MIERCSIGIKVQQKECTGFVLELRENLSSRHYVIMLLICVRRIHRLGASMAWILDRTF